jgi:thioredoxin reductase (NADPH)
MEYDLIIIGGGPAGITSAIYAARYHLKALILSKNTGGSAASAYKICNFPSYNEIKGYELMQKFKKQAEDLKVPVFYEEVIKIGRKNDKFTVFADKKSYEAKKIIYAAGTERERLNVPGEGKFLGKGVSYCATCDAAFFKNKTVCVVGGSDAALTSALLLAEYASKVYIIYRGNKFLNAEPSWIELIKKQKKIETIFNEEIAEITGDKNVEEIKLKSGKNLKLNGVFIEIGSVPQTSIIKNLNVNHAENGYIITDKNQKTNVYGFYAAGDITNNSLKQIITACSEGAVAAFNVYQELKREK